MSPDPEYMFFKDPLLARKAPSDMASLAALMGDAELTDARSPLAMAIAHFEQHVRQQLQVRTRAAGFNASATSVSRQTHASLQQHLPGSCLGKGVQAMASANTRMAPRPESSHLVIL